MHGPTHGHSMPDSGLEDYRHERLPSTSCIRVISDLRLVERSRDLEKHNDASPPCLRFTLGIVDLDTSPEYDCLSYTWGDPLSVWSSQDHAKISREWFTHYDPVICNGKTLWVKRNLITCLQMATSWTEDEASSQSFMGRCHLHRPKGYRGASAAGPDHGSHPQQC